MTESSQAANNASLIDIPVKDLMNPHAPVIAPDTPLRRLLAALHDGPNSCLTVLGSQQPVGIITERDIVHLLHAHLNAAGALALHARDFMTASPETIAMTDSAYEAFVICKTHRIRHLPVVDSDNAYVGLITYNNLANIHDYLIDQQAEIIENGIRARTLELEQANRNLRSMALTDPLLEIGNRRAMEVDLKHTLAASDRYHRPCSIILIDIDHFKGYNDHYGHHAGDLALQVVTNALQALMRDSDRLYRYGGEEFLCLLPETEPAEALVVAERLVDHLRSQQLPHAAAATGVITLSAGIAGLIPHSHMDSRASALIEQADAALYRAKHAGRNQACLNPPLCLVNNQVGIS